MLPALQAREVAHRSLPSPRAFLHRLAARPLALSNHRIFPVSANPFHALELDLSLRRFLLAVGDAGTVQVLDTADGPEAKAARGAILMAKHGEGTVRTCGWHTEDCGMFVTGSTDGTACLWDAEAGRVASTLNVRGALTGTCFAGGATLVAVTFSPPHASHPPQLRLWDVRQGPIAAHTFVLPAQATALLAPPHASFLVVGSAQGHLLYVDPRRPSALGEFSEVARESGPVHAHDKALLRIAASPDTRFIASAAADQSVKLWSCPPHCRLQRVVYEGARAPLGITEGSLVAGAGSSLAQYDLLSGRVLARLNGHLGQVLCLAAHPLEPLAFSAARDGTLLAWHPAAANRHYLPSTALRDD